MYDQDRSSDMAPEWLTANVALLDHLGVPQAPRVRSLRRQLDSRRPGVAVIGLFSRGKSTLFNWLVGSDVSPVGALPTTAVLIEASLGERSAAAHSPWDIQMLPFEPDAFCRAVSGFQDPRPHRAELHGAFRLPPGLLLVDTPGVDAASDLSEQEWYEAAAGAALVVLSLPPGPSAADAELVRQAVAVYGPNVQVVLKSTSSDISQADLREVREVAELQLGIPVLALPDAPPTGAWGDVSSPWLVVESRLLELQAASSSSGAGMLDELAQWIVGALDSIEVAKLAEPDVVRCRDLAGSDRSMPFEVSEALMRLSTRAQQRIDAEAKAREAARVDHARRANERRVTGEALVDRLHAAIAVPEIPLGPDRNNAWALLDRSSRWMVGRGEYG
ncbi:MAG: dynamin family protein, partial [Acidimicrobiales bacterium]|nr:dynamin family protein [Acidimicrobiales bacterium]